MSGVNIVGRLCTIPYIVLVRESTNISYYVNTIHAGWRVLLVLLKQVSYL